LKDPHLSSLKLSIHLNYLQHLNHQPKHQNLTKLVKNGFEEAKKDRGTIRKIIDKKIKEVAIMTKKGFDEVRSEFAEFRDQNQKEHAEMRLDLEEISSKLTGVVYRPELIELEQRLQRIETKLGLAK